MIIKDANSDTLMGVRNIPYGTYPDYGYKKGDLIVFDAVVRKDTSTSTCYDLKKYLEFVNAENVINNLSADSDMDFNLEVGINNIRILNTEGYLQARISYRQKYIGV